MKLSPGVKVEPSYVPLPSPSAEIVPLSVFTDMDQLSLGTSTGELAASQSTPQYLPPQMAVPQFILPVPYMSVPPPGFPGHLPNQGFQSGTGLDKTPLERSEYTSRQVQEFKEPDLSDWSRSMNIIKSTLRRYCAKVGGNKTTQRESSS